MNKGLSNFHDIRIKKGLKAQVKIFPFLLINLLIVSSLYALDPQDCLDCHEQAANEAAPTYDSALALSIHQDFECTDCHTEIEELPHDEKVPVVDCGTCHDDEVNIYKKHGRLAVGLGEDIPTCKDCHGKHDILSPVDRQSRVNPINLPRTCGVCHDDLNLTRKHEILYGNAVEIYKSSVHGQASLGGVYVAATCNDCHSISGTAHRILGPGDAESSINHFNIPLTCGKCHQNIENDYWEGIHGKLVARGETDSPVCTDCHGEHGIISPSDPRSRVSPARVAEATCAPCHESARLNEKYGIPSGRLQTWVDSYHGLKSRAGDLTVANCASCHGAHRILPHTDTTSSIYPANLVTTCSECHPGISVELAQTPIHGTPGISQTPIARLISQIYVVAIIVIIGLMVIHWLIDLRKQIQNVLDKEQRKRMNFNEVWQHTFLMISFLTLVITGFALRFSEAWWVKLLFGWEGGFPLRGIIHRVAAVIFILTVIWHVVYLTSSLGRKFFKDMWPIKEDFIHFVKTILFNLGFSKDRPLFRRFSYVEKAEYWALVWGTAVMIISGFFLWFDDVAVHWFPKGFLDVMLVVHYYEAWLAFLAILIWHMYSTVFSPSVYPMNPSWLNGKMPAAWYKHEHPADDGIEEEPENKNIGKKGLIK